MTDIALQARSPEWLTCKAVAKAALRLVKAKEARLAGMILRNEDHAAELQEKTGRGQGQAMTNGQARRRGTGSGIEVIYSRCRCDGFDVECLHDPTEAPYDYEALKTAEAEVREAREAHAEALAALGEAPSAFDVVANADSVGAEFVWWPSQQQVDPRTRRYQGQPMIPAEVRALGPHELQRHINTGSILKVR